MTALDFLKQQVETYKPFTPFGLNELPYSLYESVAKAMEDYKNFQKPFENKLNSYMASVGFEPINLKDTIYKKGTIIIRFGYVGELGKTETELINLNTKVEFFVLRKEIKPCCNIYNLLDKEDYKCKFTFTGFDEFKKNVTHFLYYTEPNLSKK